MQKTRISFFATHVHIVVILSGTHKTTNYVSRLLCSVAESNPQLVMNVTTGDIVDGQLVMQSCSLKYQSNYDRDLENVTVVIEHPGAEEIDTEIWMGDGEVRCVAVVEARSSNGTEYPTSFGPVLCKVVFNPARNSTDLAQNPVEFVTNATSVSFIQCKCYYIFIVGSLHLSSVGS